MLKRLSLLALPLALGGCLSAIAANENTSRVRVGQIANLGLVRVTPLQVVEDSRCPLGVQCVDAGQLRLRATVSTPTGDHRRTLTLGKPEAIGGGTLLLREVTPPALPDRRIAARDYSFVLHYRVPRAR